MTALEDNREALALGQAWARCEAALPEGWVGPMVGRTVKLDYRASVWLYAKPHLPPVALTGHTPTAALEALATKLEAVK